MKIYIDLIFLLNIVLDSILLMSVSVLLGRNVTIKRLISGSIVGGLSTLILLFNITSIELIILKLVLGILMCLTTFGYKNLKYTQKDVHIDLQRIKQISKDKLIKFEIPKGVNELGKSCFENCENQQPRAAR